MILLSSLSEFLCLTALLAACPPATPREDLEPLLEALRAVGREGAGSARAAEAFKQVAALKLDSLLQVIAALEGADPAAANWIGAAVDAIAERALERGEKLPARELEAFLLDRRRETAARELAWEWLGRVDPGAPGRLLPSLLDDPSAELRREAVARELEAVEILLASEDAGEAGRAALKTLFERSRDPRQVEKIAKRLKELGVSVDLSRHYGCIKEWRVLGPLEGLAPEARKAELPAGLPPHHAGFHLQYGPETRLDLELEHAGKTGPVRWKAVTSDHVHGLVDLNQALGKQKGAVAFALAELDVPAAMPVELRAGTPNAVKVWLNGQPLFRREEYHHGMSMDQHVAKGTLKPGHNRILVKVCQNDQTEDWAQDWKFQLRVCDSTGKGAP